MHTPIEFYVVLPADLFRGGMLTQHKIDYSKNNATWKKAGLQIEQGQIMLFSLLPWLRFAKLAKL